MKKEKKGAKEWTDGKRMVGCFVMRQTDLVVGFLLGL